MLTTKGIYSDGMVLQQNATNCIFGTADSGLQVTVEFRGKTFSATADSNNQWKIEFDAGKAGGPFEVIVKTQNENLIFKDVFVGEVWVNSGQSNAQLPMVRMKYSYPEEFQLPKNDNVRMITIPINYNFNGEQESVQNPQWKVASPETLGEFSGTAYFFAKKMAQDLGVPVGIINASQGGSPISAWLDKETLKNIKGQERCIAELEKWENQDAVEAKKADMAKNQQEWDAEMFSSDEGIKNHWEKLTYEQIQETWEDCSLPGDLDVLKSAGILWLKKEIILSPEEADIFNSNLIETNLWLGTIVDADTAFVNGVEVGVTYYSYPPRRYKVAAGLLKAGKNTITLRIQKNSKHGTIRFYKEKPYCLFTSNVYVKPCISRNVENPSEKTPEKSFTDVQKNQIYISLEGQWKMSTGTKVRDCPAGMFFEWVPTALYNAMLAPCFNYAVAGALWYQGETDAYQPEAYKDLLAGLINLWRQKFTYAKKDMPFVIMQLPSWSDGFYEDYTTGNVGWAKFRESQKETTKMVKNTALAVTIDAGEWNDLHPEKKRTGGTRAAEQALRIAYGKAYDAAPEAVCAKYTESNGKKSIQITYETGKSELKLINGASEIPGFVLVYKNAEKETLMAVSGKLAGKNQVEVELEKSQEKPSFIRYLWCDSPAAITLYGTNGLPAAQAQLSIE